MTPAILLTAAAVLLAAIALPLRGVERPEPRRPWWEQAWACAPALADHPAWQPPAPAGPSTVDLRQAQAAALKQLTAELWARRQLADIHAALSVGDEPLMGQPELQEVDA